MAARCGETKQTDRVVVTECDMTTRYVDNVTTSYDEITKQDRHETAVRAVRRRK